MYLGFILLVITIITKMVNNIRKVNAIHNNEITFPFGLLVFNNNAFASKMPIKFDTKTVHTNAHIQLLIN